MCRCGSWSCIHSSSPLYLGCFCPASEDGPPALSLPCLPLSAIFLVSAEGLTTLTSDYSIKLDFAMLTWLGHPITVSTTSCCPFCIVVFIKSSAGVKMAFEEKETHRLLEFVNSFFFLKCAFELSVLWNTFENPRQKSNRQLPSILWSWKHAALPQQEKHIFRACYDWPLRQAQTFLSHTCFHHFSAPKCLSQSWVLHTPTAMKFKDTLWK